ncbi:MAG TPA: M20/M25/M40 family metallo-hydrolase [Acidimicrobiia bacterium]|nr:M20/M25/M40 family metallo-hydrolase [Acidimicrobiia bacterium]
MPDWSTLGDEAVEITQQYLRIDTTNPPGNETPAAEFLGGILRDAGYETTVLESAPGRGNLVARRAGRAGDAGGALCLLHHLDVVPADASEWSVDPFGGEIHDGYLWGRGAIDMKSMGVMQLMTMLALARDDTALERDVVFVAVADEEAGGVMGAAWLTKHHPELVACRDVINEGGYGLAETKPPMMACALSEKALLWVKLTARGTPGHGSMPPEDQAIGKLLAALGDLAAHPPALAISPLVARTFRALAARASAPRRKAIEAILHPRARRVLPALSKRLPRYQRALLGDVISMTRLDAGYKDNVVPGAASATLDCRLVPETDPEEFFGRLSARMARFGVTCEVLFTDGPCGVSEGPLLPLMEQVCGESFPDVAFAPVLCPAFTDSRYFRQLGADAYGLVPVMLSNAEVATFHGIDERIPLAGLKKGCRVVHEITARACT